ncbi:hypothetical protein HZA43_03615 [Candidatus Peregrinibacteria bacterium]|nr:hypothetical protein [Candidatus Peregrinibacteria bacterium]
MERFQKIIVTALLCISLALTLAGVSGQGKVYAKPPADPGTISSDSGGAPASPAATPSKKPETDPVTFQELVKKTLQASTTVNRIFSPMIHFLVFQIGNFLGNDYIYGGDMGTMLHTIWVIMRNIVNVIFALILLAIALMNVIRPEGDSNFAIKKTLPKLVLVLIAVNFSWMASRVILDAANVATNIIFQIPAGVQSVGRPDPKDCTVDSTKNTYEGDCAPYKIYFPFDGKEADYNKENCPPEDEIDKAYAYKVTDSSASDMGPEKQAYDKYFGKRIFCWQTMDFTKYNQNTASLFLSYGMVKVQKIGQMSQAIKEGDTIKAIDKTFIGTVFALAIQIVYLATFLALWLGLLARTAALWLLVAFSPILLLALAAKEAGVNLLPEQLSFNSFIDYAFIPAKVGAVLSIGFIMIAAGQTMGDFSSNSTGKILEITNFAGMETLQQFIWLVMVIVVVWMGVFAILGKTPGVSHLTGWIGELGNRAGKFISTAPKWAPIIPLGVDKQTGKAKWRSAETIDREVSDKFHDALREFQGIRGTSQNEADKLAEMLRKDERARQELVKTTDHKDIVTKINATLKIDREKLRDVTRDNKLTGLLTSGGIDATNAERITAAVRQELDLNPAAAGSAVSAPVQPAAAPPLPPAPPAPPATVPPAAPAGSGAPNGGTGTAARP